MSELLTTENLIAFLTLTSLEIVLGIDNIIFIAILAGRMEEKKRNLARQLGLMIAVISRIGLLLAIGWVMQLKEELFALFGHAVTGKDLVLMIGGLFLIGKSTVEIHHKVEGEHDSDMVTGPKMSMAMMCLRRTTLCRSFSCTCSSCLKRLSYHATRGTRKPRAVALAALSHPKRVRRHSAVNWFALTIARTRTLNQRRYTC